MRTRHTGTVLLLLTIGAPQIGQALDGRSASRFEEIRDQTLQDGLEHSQAETVSVLRAPRPFSA